MIKDTIQAVRALFSRRSFAYRRVFNLDNPDVEIVLNDLAKFCRAYETTYNPDPRIHALLEGRKEVWIRLQNHLQLNQEELYRLHTIREQGEKR